MNRMTATLAKIGKHLAAEDGTAAQRQVHTYVIVALGAAAFSVFLILHFWPHR